MSGDAAMALDFEGKWNPFVKKMESQNYSGDFALLRAMALNAKALDLTLLHRLVARMKSEKYRALARRWWRQEIRPLLILALVLFSIRSSLADWNNVPTGSMKPTILEGDRVFVNKLAYDLKVPFTTWHIAQWSNPQRGDIVVFFSPKNKENHWLPRWSRTCSALDSKAE